MERTRKAQILLLCYLLNMHEHADLLSANMKQAWHFWAQKLVVKKKCIEQHKSDCLRDLYTSCKGGLN